MIPRQNRIDLRTAQERDSEVVCILDNPDDVNVLPGALCEYAESEPHGIAYTQANDITTFEPIVVIENVFFGSAISAKQYDGDKIYCRRLLPGDIYLIRAVPGVYNQGDPLYATQRDNGIYVSRRGEGRFLGWAKESVVIREEDVDIVDERIDNPEPEAINNKKLNLLRVKVGFRPYSAVNPLAPKHYLWTASSLGTDWAKEVSGTIAKGTNSSILSVDIVFEEPLPMLKASEITVEKVSFVPKCQVYDSENMIFIDPPAPTVSLVDEITGEGTSYRFPIEISGSSAGTLVLSLTIKKEDAQTATVYFKSVLASSLGSEFVEDTTGPVVGYWGVTYPDLLGTSTPTEEEILSLSGVTKIYGKPRPMSVSFRVNEEDWKKCGGGEFDNTSVGRAFFVCEWGRAITSIQKGDDIKWQEFRPFHITIDEKPYHGYIASYPIAYDGAPYSFYVSGS